MEGASSAAGAIPNPLAHVEMSLDDCIRSRKKVHPAPKPAQKKSAPPKKKSVNGKTGPKPSPKKAAPGQTAAAPPRGNRVSPPAAGGIAKKRSRGRKPSTSAAASAAKTTGAGSNAQSGPKAAPPANMKHGGGLMTKRGAEKAAASAAASTAGCRIAVSNLNEDVSEEDIKELFGAVGPLVSSKLIPSPEGRSARRAEVIFVQMAHALEAIKRYNGVPLDDMPLKITLATERAAATLQSRVPAAHSRPWRGGRKNFTPLPHKGAPRRS
jgi:RNA recognition motif. (a.k.a. RRM, RBD, or RNP domain)